MPTNWNLLDALRNGDDKWIITVTVPGNITFKLDEFKWQERKRKTPLKLK